MNRRIFRPRARRTARTPSALAIGAAAFAGALIGARALRRRRRLDLDNCVAVITGGSRGLGLLIARQLGKHGARLMLAARDEAELARARTELQGQGVTVATTVADVGVQADAERVVAETIERYGRIDILINNAGVIRVGPLDHMTIADFEESMAVHFWAPLHTTRAAIPHMRRQGGGRIANVSSIGGKVAVPHLAAYCAGKFALTGFSSAARAELARDRILVTTVAPGLIRTGSPFNAWFKGNHREEFAWFAIADSLPVLSINADRAAAQIVDAIRHGDAELTISLPARVATAAAALIPRTVAGAMRMTNALLPKPSKDNRATSYSGWQSGSAWAPSLLTRLSEKSAARNNELPNS